MNFQVCGNPAFNSNGFYCHCIRPSLASTIPCGKPGSLTKIFSDEVSAIM